MSIPFCKFHGFGNDYIVIERQAIDPAISLDELAIAMCHRHTGAGSDGIAVVSRAEGDDADLFCEIINPDGSTAGFSGNGTRCAVAYLYYKELWSDQTLRLATRSGVKRYDLLSRPSPAEFWFEAEIGRPRFASREVPISTDGDSTSVIDEPFLVDGIEYLISGVNVGNPVGCIFVDDLDFDWLSPGQRLETHDKFPERANIVFVKVVDRQNIEIRIWERGAGETSSSGTCSSGAAVLSAFRSETDRRVNVHAEGGITKVHWRDDGEIVLTGRADLAYCGEWPS